MSRRFNKFEFGFLNTAQDPTDIADHESPSLLNLDPDKLALGTLEHNDYLTEGDTAKDYTETTLGSREFSLETDGTIDSYTTYDDSGYYYADQTWFESVSILSSNITYDPGTYWAFDIKLNSLSDGFIIGNAYNTVSEISQMQVRMVSNQLVVNVAQGGGVSGNQSIVIAASPSVDVWYRVAIHVYVDGTVEYDTYLDGVKQNSYSASYPSGSTAPSRPGGLYFGGGPFTGFDGASFDFKHLIICDGQVGNPGGWDTTTPSLNLQPLGSVILSSRNGTGADNAQDIPFLYASVQPVVTDPSSPQEGKVTGVISNSDRSIEVPESTEFNYTSASTVESVGYTDPFTLSDNLFIGMRIHKVVTDYATVGADVDLILFAISSVSLGVGGSDFTLHLVGNKLTLNFDSAIGTVVYNDFVSAESLFLAWTITNDSTTSTTEYNLTMYINGVVVHTDSLNTVPAIFSGTRYVTFPNYDSGSVGTWTQRHTVRDFYMGSMKDGTNADDFSAWKGSRDFVERRVNLVASAQGDLANTNQGLTASPRAGDNLPSVRSASQLTGVGNIRDFISDGVGPTTPDKPTATVEEYLQIDFGNLPSGLELAVIGNRAFNGPEDVSIVFGRIGYTIGLGTGEYLEYRVDGQAGFPNRAILRNGEYQLNHYNLTVVSDRAAGLLAGPYSCQVKSPKLLDGKYQYRLVAVRTTDTKPKSEIESPPSEVLDTDVNNIDAAGKRVGNNVNVIQLPAASPGFPDYVDRLDLYRKDPDSEEYVKVFEHSQVVPVNHQDSALITELPRIEFMKTENDETFAKLDEAIGNDSGNYVKIFNKDNRLWLVPSDRQDLLLYSRPNDWWGWRRENSFSFNGDIVDITPMRDPTAVSGLSTLIITTTRGIYHVVGSGTQDSPYTLLPVVGGDGFVDIETQANSVVPANGTLLLTSKSTDGGYDTGAYGQKVYQYDLQKLTEISNRIQSSLPSSSILRASLVGSDKYLLRSDANSGFVYHMDARNWVEFDDTEDGWRWQSKKFDRQIQGQGTVANASMYKIDYIGDITINLYVKPYGSDAYPAPKTIALSSVGRTMKTNMLPANMGEQWYFTVQSANSVGKVYNMWFVS